MHKFEVGDLVDVVFTYKEYDAFISHRVIRKMMEKNPHKVVGRLYDSLSSDAENYRYILEGSTSRWPPDILNLPSKEPDWIL